MMDEHVCDSESPLAYAAETVVLPLYGHFKLEACQTPGMDLSEWDPCNAASTMHEQLRQYIYDLGKAGLAILEQKLDYQHKPQQRFIEPALLCAQSLTGHIFGIQ